MNIGRTHHCGTIRAEQAGQTVELKGWVDRRRDLGGVIFIDLRDRSGIVQIVFHPEQEEALALADRSRPEYILAVKGTVVIREEDTINTKIDTGHIEVEVKQAEVISSAKTPPFAIEDNIDVDESIRLKYRYLDLRRPEMQRTFELRHKATKVFRDYLDEQDFLEIETPILTRSTPEGARDYLVPSRVHPGDFFALPQSPQLFKQMLMVSGMERYFQVVRCFRDEDLRADRQPEFTQVDVETSFMSIPELHKHVETMMARLFEQTLGVDLPTPFETLSYDEAMSRFGSDKPDLRFGLELQDVSAIIADSDFKVFTDAVAKGGQVKGFAAKGCASYTRKEIDDLTELARRFGAKGLAWILFKDGELKSPILKFFTEQQLEQIKVALQAEDGDLLLFVADKKQVVADVLGQLRLYFGEQLQLLNRKEFRMCWVVDFPLVEYDAEQKRYVALHHPFTMPREKDIELLQSEPAQAKAQAYDLVLNGYEIAGGSMRIYKREIQEQMFKVLGLSEQEAQEKFGFLLEAFDYGAPPHGGIAFGLDRIVMLLAGRKNLREVIAFPKTSSASCLLTSAPSSVDKNQLDQLSLRVHEEIKTKE